MGSKSVVKVVVVRKIFGKTIKYGSITGELKQRQSCKPEGNETN